MSASQVDGLKDDENGIELIPAVGSNKVIQVESITKYMDPSKIKLDPEEQWYEDHAEEFVPVSAKEKQRFRQNASNRR